jgi:antitoxin HicB
MCWVAKNAHIGSSLEAFLDQEGLLEEATATAVKRVVAWQVADAMKRAGVTKVEMAARMRTSRTLLDRLLDANDAGLTLDTLGRAAAALDLRVHLELRPVPTRGRQQRVARK